MYGNVKVKCIEIYNLICINNNFQNTGSTYLEMNVSVRIKYNHSHQVFSIIFFWSINVQSTHINHPYFTMGQGMRGGMEAALSIGDNMFTL